MEGMLGAITISALVKVDANEGQFVWEALQFIPFIDGFRDNGFQSLFKAQEHPIPTKEGCVGKGGGALRIVIWVVKVFFFEKYCPSKYILNILSVFLFRPRI